MKKLITTVQFYHKIMPLTIAEIKKYAYIIRHNSVSNKTEFS